jgi:competence protein ComEC
VSFAGLLLNFIAIPLMSVIQVAGLAAVASAGVLPPLAAACGWIAHIGTAALLRSAGLVDVAPWLVADVPPPAVWVLVLWYSAWTTLFIVRRPRLRRAALAAIVVAGVILLSAPDVARRTLVEPPPEGWTRVVVLDVGQGDATLVQPVGARPFLVDAGGVPGSTFDVGRRVTLPAAWACGVHTLSALVLTHGDPDHIGGAPAVLRALAPGAVWEGIPVPRHEPLRRLHDAAARAGIPWLERRAGEVVRFGSMTVTVLNPPEPDWERQKVRNDDSLVLELRVGSVAVVLPGDISSAVERAVVERFTPAPLVIIKAPHHGSAGSSSQPFIEALHPAAVIFSAGKRNPFGHPAPPAVDRYRSAGATVFSTADEGAVVIDTDGHAVRVWTWTGRSVEFAAPDSSSRH